MTTHAKLELQGAMRPGFDEVLTADALEFVAELHRRFGEQRSELLDARAQRRARLAAGGLLDFLPETRDGRENSWRGAAGPPDLQQPWVENTRPTHPKVTINAPNFGAD